MIHCSITDSTNYASLDEADTTQPSNLQYQTNPSTSGRLLFVTAMYAVVFKVILKASVTSMVVCIKHVS